MGRENISMLQKFYTLVLQPRKTLLLYLILAFDFSIELLSLILSLSDTHLLQYYEKRSTLHDVYFRPNHLKRTPKRMIMKMTKLMTMILTLNLNTKDPMPDSCVWFQHWVIVINFVVISSSVMKKGQHYIMYRVRHIYWNAFLVF